MTIELAVAASLPERGRESSWNPPFPTSDVNHLQLRARTVALSIADSVKDPKLLERAIARSLFQTGLPSQRYWTPYSVAQGYASLALLFAHLYRCFPTANWEKPAAAYLELAVSGALIHSTIPMGALTGLAGLFFAGRYLETSCGVAIEATSYLERKLCEAASITAAKVAGANGSSVSDVDIVSGLSGVSIILQTYGSRFSEKCSIEVLDALASLAGSRKGLPNLHCPMSLANPHDSIAKQFPNGFINFGLAHGIAGPLFALSMAVLTDGPHRYSSGCEQLADLLSRSKGADEFGPNWPAAVDLSAFQNGATWSMGAVHVSTRTAWCYGNPGVCRSLRVAAKAVNSAPLHQLSLAGIRSSVQRPWQQISSPTFCHGLSGLLQVLMRFAAEERTAEFLDSAQACVSRLLEMYEESLPFGYCSVELGNLRVDQPGLLDGAAGVALSLLSFSEPIDPAWDRIFAIG